MPEIGFSIRHRMNSFMKLTLPIDIESQPSDSSCGPTCLQAIYRYWGQSVPVSEIIADIPQLESGGTLAVQLACHALDRGFEATIFTYNLQIFDPTWFLSGTVDLPDCLRRQRKAKVTKSPRFALATNHYLRFLDLGGRVLMQRLDRQLIREHLKAKIPMLAGLSATFLYQESRERSHPPDERGVTCISDDIGGHPVGHFVVLSGYDEDADAVMISDPLHPNPKRNERHYWSPIEHVSAAIFLGIVTYDANLLVIQPKMKERVTQ